MKNIKEYFTESLINEAKYKGDISKYSETIKKIYDEILVDMQGSDISIDLSINGMPNGLKPNKKVNLQDFKHNAIKRSIGHIIEAFVLAKIQSYKNEEGWNEYFSVTQSNNDVYDADISLYDPFKGEKSENIKLEVKAYTGNKDNINFTKNQQQNLKNTLLIYIQYTYEKGKTVHIDDILIGKYEDVQNGKSTIGKHGGRTKQMVSVKQNKEEKN